MGSKNNPKNRKSNDASSKQYKGELVIPCMVKMRISGN